MSKQRAWDHDADELQPFEPRHLETLRQWWSAQEQVLAWAGPHFRYPFTVETFREDLRLGETTSRVLISENGEMAAFGQYYLFHQRVHLARLACAPELRGAGWGGRLVRGLVAEGQRTLGASEASLYVKRTNRPALRCYRAQGFTETEPPQDPRRDLPGMEDVVFLVCTDWPSSSQ